ncbi:MAG: MBL fold metallo-hydrolase [Candidatus Sedimenticola sp. (ex Thyasira tokunagai)]
MKLRQLFDTDSGSYSYLLWDKVTRHAVIIDPVKEQSARDIRLIHELQLKLLYSLETHIHADHVTGGTRLRDEFGCSIGVHRNAHLECADLWLEEDHTITFGNESLRILHTPGHTDTDISYLADSMVFTGDILLIRGSGRTDFQLGDPGLSHDSITTKLFTLPDDTLVYPAHDYTGLTATTIGEERKLNPRLGGDRSRADYIDHMQSLHLEKPKHMSVAVPGNLKCGAP